MSWMADGVAFSATAPKHRVRVATVLAAYAQLDVRARAAAFLDRDLHQLTHARLVNRGEGVGLADFQLGIRRQEAARVVAVMESAGVPPAVIGASPTTPAHSGSGRWSRSWKNSAVCAISSAVSAPRGTSIIVPTT
jgi:hypothetical protein